MTEITRYRVQGFKPGIVTRDPNGPWVSYIDHKLASERMGAALQAATNAFLSSQPAKAAPIAGTQADREQFRKEFSEFVEELHSTCPTCGKAQHLLTHVGKTDTVKDNPDTPDARIDNVIENFERLRLTANHMHDALEERVHRLENDKPDWYEEFLGFKAGMKDRADRLEHIVNNLNDARRELQGKCAKLDDDVVFVAADNQGINERIAQLETIASSLQSRMDALTAQIDSIENATHERSERNTQQE